MTEPLSPYERALARALDLNPDEILVLSDELSRIIVTEFLQECKHCHHRTSLATRQCILCGYRAFYMVRITKESTE